MRKISTLLVGAAVVGSLGAGLVATPASATTQTAASAAQAQFSRHHFGPFYESYHGSESRSHRSYYDGWWYTSGGRMYFDFNTYDRDRDREVTVIIIQVHDDRGWHNYKAYRTSGHHYWRHIGGFDTDRYDGFRFRIGEGNSRDWDYSRWYSHSW